MSDQETALLGACLLSANALGIAQEEMEPDDLSPNHRRIYEAMIRVQDRLGPDESVDPIAAAGELGDQLELVGGKAYIHSLITMCPTATNVRMYAKQVRDGGIQRRLRTLCYEGLEAQSGEEMQSALEDGLYREERPSQRPVLMSDALAAFESGDESQFVFSYPWERVQRHTQGKGIRAGELVIIAGRPSMGKTACAVTLTDQALRHGRDVLFFSLEMHANELAERLNMTAEDPKHERYGRWRVVTQATRVSEMIPLVRRYKPDVVVVDYLQLLDIGSDTRTEGTTKNTRNLKLMAMRYDVPVIALSQLNRGNRDVNRVPGLMDLRDSGSIEQDANHVIFVWRKTNTETGQLTEEGMFVVGKIRNGTTGAGRFTWDGTKQRFNET